jgi:hypothetical protein
MKFHERKPQSCAKIWIDFYFKFLTPLWLIPFTLNGCALAPLSPLDPNQLGWDDPGGLFSNESAFQDSSSFFRSSESQKFEDPEPIRLDSDSPDSDELYSTRRNDPFEQADFAPPEESPRRDIFLGMEMRDVRDIWGIPLDIESAGDPRSGNQRWVYPGSLEWVSYGKRLVYFEAGRVVGWETLKF